MLKRECFSEERKRKIVQEVLSGEFTKEQARRIYGIKSKSGILEWMRSFASIPPKSHGVDPLSKLRMMKQETDETAKLKARIAELEEQLVYSELKGRAYQIMVENAKRDYNLDFEKKPGAKSFINSKKKDRK